MKKIKVFATGAVLLLATVFVFARSPKFIDSYEIYGLSGASTWTPMLNNQNIILQEFRIGLSLSNPVKISQNFKFYLLYYYDVTPTRIGPVAAIVLQ